MTTPPRTQFPISSSCCRPDGRGLQGHGIKSESGLSERKTPGFTLPEILVVTAVIAVLAALLYGVAAKLLSAADAAKCSSNLRSIGGMTQLYASENNGKIMPPMIYWDAGLADAFSTRDNTDVWRCPADKIPRNRGKTWPGDNARVAPPRSYVLSGFVHNLWGVHPAYAGHRANTAATQQNIADPSKMWILTESHQTSEMALDLVIGEHGGSIIGGAAGAYHGTNVNVLFLDGHVDSVPFKTSGAWFWRHTGL